ncbi:tetratricopeptide repeat protein [Olivibacter sitiensis]|uniref:tetratricopeptide repeat protein n=1 Tax=Olivibacter sitiensis TaxID=376470 RepID=UPI000428621F|nr:tetratricopeptide repeat protein [Olivibacter sitiensis]
MKIKSFLFAALVMGTSLSFAQKGELNKAKSSYEKYSTLSGGAFTNLPDIATKEMANAKASIDKAKAHEKTSSLPETWILASVLGAEETLINEQSGNQDAAEASYKEADEALSKSNELEGKVPDDIAPLKERSELLLAYYLQNKGVKEFQEGKYAEAQASWDKALSYDFDNDEVKNSLYYFGGLAAQANKDYDKSIENFQKLIPGDNSDAYIGLSDTYWAKGDTVQSIKVMDEAASKFPDSSKIVQARIIKYLNVGKGNEVISELEEQVKADPSNSDYPFFLGIAYESAGDKEKALESYKKGIEAAPEDVRNYGNAAVIILNQTNDKIAKASSIKTQDEYDKAVAEAVAEADKALPYLEKALQLEPNSEMNLRNMRAYYQLKGEDAKAEELTQKINNL